MTGCDHPTGRHEAAEIRGAVALRAEPEPVATPATLLPLPTEYP